jgi:hypothetical protein
VLLTKLENNRLLLRLVHKEVLDLGVILKEAPDDVEFSVLLTLHVHVHNLGKGSKSPLQELSISIRQVVLKELVESLAKSLGGELDVVAVLGTVDDLGEQRVELLRHASVQSGELGVPFAERQLGVTQDLNQFLKRQVHDDGVVVTLEDVAENVV